VHGTGHRAARDVAGHGGGEVGGREARHSAITKRSHEASVMFFLRNRIVSRGADKKVS
jgi:hypothetical protein